MASSASGAPTAPQSTPGQSRNDGSSRGRGSRGRGRGKGRGRGRGNANAQDGRQKDQTTSTPNFPKPTAPKVQADDARSVAGTDPDADLCFICANAVTHYSVAPCNHRTCHICGLRMRALYKTKDCAHCRTQAPFVIFTDDPEKRFEDFTPKEITSADDNIGIRYTNEDIVGDTVLLLRYNCPDPSCDFAGLGWPDLHRHVKSTHQKRMCDLCTRNKKVFTHEHELFQDKELERHMRHGDDRPGALDQTGFKGHPICGFCGERFYDDDKLYEHCRNKHERCFICDRRNPRQPHYFLNYNALERHFRDDHFLCIDRECLEKKFVVFESELDLKAHQLSEHGNSLSKDVRQDARIVNLADFNYRQSYQHERRGGGDRDGRGRGGGRGRDPNAEPLPASSAQMSRDEIAFQRQMAIHSAQSVSNRNFGSQLSAAPRPAAPTSRPAAGRAPPSSQAVAQTRAPVQPLDSAAGAAEVDISTLSPQERARVLRHGEVIDRAQNLLSGDATKMNRFRADVSSYKNGRLTAPKFLDALFTLFSDTSSNSLGVLVRELADLFEDGQKAEGLRKAWQDWRAINEDYPSLPGLGGMHGATTSNSGWAAAATASPASPAGAAAQKHSTRVLRLKSSTRQSIGGGGQSSSSSAATPSSSWTTAAGGGVGSRGPPPAASSFPALPVASRPAASSAASRPSWVGSAAGSGQGGTSLRSRPERGEDAFPALPAAPKPLTSIFGYGRGSVRRDWGQSRDTGFSWGGNGQQQGEGSAVETPDEGTGKKKKGKKVLVQWG